MVNWMWLLQQAVILKNFIPSSFTSTLTWTGSQWLFGSIVISSVPELEWKNFNINVYIRWYGEIEGGYTGVLLTFVLFVFQI